MDNLLVMEINGLTLPVGFVRDLESRRFCRARGGWGLRQNQSAYGEPLETELGEVYEDAEAIQRKTDELPDGFVEISAEDVEGYAEIYGVSVGEIPYFWDFEKIVCFAMSGDGAPFCFDYRENEREPAVIWWADAYWQRVAPDYDSFVALFD